MNFYCRMDSAGSLQECYSQCSDCKLKQIKDEQIRHVYPTFWREHITDKRSECWCQPKVDFVEGGAIIIHEAEQ